MTQFEFQNKSAAAIGGFFGGVFFGYCITGLCASLLLWGLFGAIVTTACEE